MYVKVTMLILTLAIHQLVSSFGHGSSTKTVHDLGTANQNAVSEHAAPLSWGAFVNKMNDISALLDFNNIVFIILSQRDPYNAGIAKRLKEDIINQLKVLNKGQADVHLTHEDFQVTGDFTIVPLMHPLLKKYKNSDVRWAVFIEPLTAVRCDKLVEAIAEADEDLDIKWMGYPLTDEVPTVIHLYHYYKNLPYPFFSVGFAMRLELMDTLIHQLSTGDRVHRILFTIDPSFELAALIYGNSTDPGSLLTPDPSFCLTPADHCATYQKQTEICGSPISERSIFFAVKTWSGYHKTRVKIVKKTWGRHVSNIMFYSDKADPSLPSVDTGTPNVVFGHCRKTIAILKMVLDRVKKMPHIKWIFLADDDTILGVHRLTEVLSCYKGGSEFTVLGERYGYGYDKKITSASAAYNTGYFTYITTGGGAIFSLAAAATLSECPCQAFSSPDDLSLGECAKFNNYTFIHSPLFHQQQPQCYPSHMLSGDKPVSFHHHGSVSPTLIYATWFQRDDVALSLIRDEL